MTVITPIPQEIYFLVIFQITSTLGNLCILPVFFSLGETISRVCTIIHVDIPVLSQSNSENKLYPGKKNTQIRLFNVQPRTEDNLWSYSTLSVTILSQVSEGGGGVVKRTTHASVVTGTHGNTPLVPLLSRHRRSLCTTLLLHILRLYGKTPK